MTAHPLQFDSAIDVLRALAEPTRCRLLALLSHGELTVGEMAEVLGQSQPRISRHLKLLSDVAALERFREEQRIYYRLTSDTQTAQLVSLVLARIDVTDAILQRDQQQLVQVRDQRVRSVSAQWALVRRSAESTYSDVRLVNAFIRALFDKASSHSLGDLLDVGTGSGSMLSVLAARARHAVGLDISTQALRLARARVHGAGLNQCVFKRGDMYDLPFNSSSFDAVSFDHVLSTSDKPGQALKEAVRVLRQGGRIIIVEDKAKLAEMAAENPQVLMRRWLERAGVQCDQVKALRSGQKAKLLGVATRQ